MSPPARKAGPVGQGEYLVQAGDCVLSIADRAGHAWETIWNDPANADLKAARGEPTLLAPGDRVTIPPLRAKEETGATEQRHSFRRKGQKVLLRVRVVQRPEPSAPASASAPAAAAPADPNECSMEEPAPQADAADEPRADVPYALVIDGKHYDGRTGDDGTIEVPIAGGAGGGELVLNPGTDDEERISLRLGGLDPVSELSGVQQRLLNLGLYAGAADGEESPALEDALREFQQRQGLQVTGAADQATRDKLVEAHGA